MRFEQLQAGADDDGPIGQGASDPVPGPGPGSGGALVRVEAAPSGSRVVRAEVVAAAADAAADTGTSGSASDAPTGAGAVSATEPADSSPATAGSAVKRDPTAPVAVTPKPPVSAAPAVFAVSEIIRSAADQAAATWQYASLPAQRRESPVVPYQQAGAPAEAAAPPAAEPFAATAAAPELESPEPESADPAPPPPAATEPAAVAAPEPEHHHHWRSARRQISLLVKVVCVLVLAVLLGHRFLPDVMGFGSLIDTFLPWTFVPLLLAVPAALLSLDKWAVGVAVLACGVWGGDFGPQLARSPGSGPSDLRILSQNVSSPNPDLTDVARLAEQRQADIVVLQGLSARDVQQADQSVPAGYPYHLAMYEFVVWSRFKLVNGSVPMDLAAHPDDPTQVPAAIGSTSGQFGGLLRFGVELDPSRVATVYAVHLPQPSLSHNGFGLARGDALKQLVAAVRAEKEPNLVVVGDLDLAQTDRGMSTLLNSATGLASVQAKAGGGFGFTWPAGFPMVRLDDVLTRGLKPVRSVVLPATGAKQAHRPIEADLRF